jgi:hypothetical protein
MTATGKKKTSGEKPVEPKKQDAFEQKVEQTAESLLKGCSKVRVRCSWFSTSAKIDDAVMGEMMGDTAKHIRDAISASKRLLKSKDKALVSAKQAFQAITDYVNSMTIPMIALRAASDEEGSLRKDGGVRLIQKKDMKEFDTRMQYLMGVLKTAVQNLQAAMPRIKEEDRVRLSKLNSKLFNDNDYPEDVTKLVGVEYGFEPIGVDAEWEVLCPEIYARESINARKRYEAVVESAAVEYATRLVKYVEQVTRQLGNRVRLSPKEGFKKQLVTLDDESQVVADINDAEVIRKLTRADDDEIPAGSVKVRVRLTKDAGAKGKSQEAWLPVTKDAVYYGELQPYETEEKNKLFDSTIDNLKAELEAFANVGEMFGPYKDVVTGGIDKIKDMLKKASSSMNTSSITQQLREGSFFRNQMKGTLEEVAKAVEQQVTVAKERRRTVKTVNLDD